MKELSLEKMESLNGGDCGGNFSWNSMWATILWSLGNLSYINMTFTSMNNYGSCWSGSGGGY